MVVNPLSISSGTTEQTGAGTTVATTSNCPAVTPGAIYTWLKTSAPDGSTVYIPVWK